MFKKFLLKFVHARTMRNKFNIIIGLIVLIVLFGLLNFWFGIKVTSGIRAYVGGEGLWSKAEKEAVNNLVRYARTSDSTYYDKYLGLTKVQEGDNRARLELDKSKPNYLVIRDGFVQGGNDPGDVDDMIFLYRNFRRVSYMKAAIADWAAGDQEMVHLKDLGAQVHSLVLVGAMGDTATYRAKLSDLLVQTYDSDNRLTVLENRFSATLSNGSRRISNQLLQMTIFITVLLGVLTVITAVLIARAVIRLDTLKTEFVSLASHQLRTPLTAINWYTEALLDGSRGPLTATQREYLNELYGGGKRMSGLISDLLRVSSLDLGTYKSELTLKQVDEVLHTVIKDLQAVIDKKRLALSVNIDPALPKIKLDEQLLTAVLQNLLTNSVKYTPDAGTITVDVGRQKQYMLIHVADSGIGIPSSQQSQIFKKLFRADNAKQLDSNGSGLGLYIVRAVTKRMGGTVRFTSTEGHGSDFYVKLPLYRGLNARPDN